MNSIFNKKIDAVVYDSKSAFPFEMKVYEDLKKERFSSFSSAIESITELKGKSNEEEKAYLKKLEKIENVLKEQEASIAKLEKDSEQNTKKAELIYSNYQLIKEIIDELKKAEKKYSWKEIKEKLKNHKIIKEVNSKDKTVILEL